MRNYIVDLKRMSFSNDSFMHNGNQANASRQIKSRQKTAYEEKMKINQSLPRHRLMFDLDALPHSFSLHLADNNHRYQLARPAHH